jgi:hypothetical protein
LTHTAERLFDSPERDVYSSSEPSDCSIKLDKVTSNTASTSRRRRATLARLTAFVLLLFISYGATAEVAHKHCSVLPAGRADVAKTTISNPSDANTSSERSRNGGECLICQLHQHLFTSLLNTLPQIAPPPAQFVRLPAAAVSYHVQLDAPQRGRAPPTTSLL